MPSCPDRSGRILDEPLNLKALRSDLTFYPVPFDKIVAEVCPDAQLRRLVKNMIYDGVLSHLLPEAEEVDVQINANDLRIDVFRSTGPGGQSVNTTDSAVRITHLPTGLVVACQDEKSQHKNKAKGLKVLRARLLERAQAEQQAEVAENRRSMVGTGDRSERIRTYNFPQGRLNDHRINLTLYSLDRVMDGEADAVVRHPVLRKVVLSNLLGPLAAADLGAAVLIDRIFLPLQLLPSFTGGRCRTDASSTG